APVDLSDVDAEEVNPMVRQAGTHRKAIVKNAKAKMIEGTFDVLQGILRGMRIPGYVKDLGGDPDENDVDQEELQKLARQGKLLTFWEFARALFQAMDYYNREKTHRGLLREWAWKPKPAQATPMDCLERCYHEGWRPVYLSDEAVDLVFLPRAERTVDRGRITFRGEQYEADALVRLPKSTRLEIRYDPLDLEWILCFRDGEFLCRAEPVEYSSMKDRTLAQRKIEEKRRRRKGFILEYRALTRAVPDVMRYSETPWIEKAAAQVGRAKRVSEEKLLAEAEENRVRTQEELNREVAVAEARQNQPKDRARPLPKRPSFFLDPLDRYKWALEYKLAGGDLTEEDRDFCEGYEAEMSEGQREYWETYKEMGGSG
ncbi:MAG: Mu transposase C-terminal domain-containing protein, partial [Desulfobacteraceae bacterium]